MTKLPSLLCAATTLLVAASPYVSAQPRPRGALPDAIDSIAQSYLKDGRAAGMSIAVVKGTDTIALKAYGLADLEWSVPTPPRAVYEIGSVTKQFTAAAILMLRDEKKFSLDDDITTILPKYPTQGHRVTIRRLLDHTSGIKGYTELRGFGAMASRDLPKDSLLALFENEKFDFLPGDAQVYNNSAYFLLGLIVEKASGMSYADFVQKRIFDKVGMSDSRYCSERTLTPHKTHGYEMGPTGLVNKGYIVHTYPYSAGSLCSTAGDLAAWVRALHAGRVLSPVSYREMISPASLSDGTKLRYGMGLALHTFGGHRTIEHGGAIPGYLSEAAYFPDQDAIIVVLINTAGPVAPAAVTQSIADLLFGTITPTALAPPTNIAALAGRYTGVGRGAPMKVVVTADSGKLMVTLARLPAAAARYVGNDTWEVSDTRLTFGKNTAGAPTLRVDSSYGYSVLTRVP